MHLSPSPPRPHRHLQPPNTTPRSQPLATLTRAVVLVVKRPLCAKRQKTGRPRSGRKQTKTQDASRPLRSPKIQFSMFFFFAPHIQPRIFQIDEATLNELPAEVQHEIRRQMSLVAQGERTGKRKAPNKKSRAVDNKNGSIMSFFGGKR